MNRDYSNPAADHAYQQMQTSPGQIPISFAYNGVKYQGFGVETFLPLSTQTFSEDGKESTFMSFSLRQAPTLHVHVLMTHYFTHGVTEWTAYFENTSSSNSGILETIQCSLAFQGDKPMLQGIYGDWENQYKPYCFDLEQAPVSFRSDRGRATHGNFPYFDLSYGCGGAMLVIGWAGTWSADFVLKNGTVNCTLQAVNGMRTYLKPGETVRSALFVLAPYSKRDGHYAANYWRSWYVQWNLPKADATGAALQPFSTACFAGDTGLVNSDGSISENHRTWRPTMEKILEEGLQIDFRWFDAGWYQSPDLGSAESYAPSHDWWDVVGTWTLDPVKWPGQTFRESVDFAHAHGMKTLMWFEPERVTSPELLEKNFGYDVSWAICQDGTRDISNNIGNEACLDWTVGQICKTLRDNKVDMYREDFNCDPAPLWKHMDELEGADRSGITECKLINSHYVMWDRIIACTSSYGGCSFLDSCASGGGRNDLESLRRAVPLLRSDSDRTSTALRLSMTSSFNKWIPFCGANTQEKEDQCSFSGNSDTYIWRASYLPVLNVVSQYVQKADQDFDILRFGLQEWHRIKPYLLKEFYTLTPWHSEQENNSFTAFAFFDPDTENGVLLAFRQERCEQTDLTVQLPEAMGSSVHLTDEDTGETWASSGNIRLQFDTPRSSKLIWIGRD